MASKGAGNLALRGVKCNICGAYGEHRSHKCPLRGTVGIPKDAQLTLADDSVVCEKGAPVTETLLRADAVHKLLDDVRHAPPFDDSSAWLRHPSVPTALQCYGCTCLATSPTWLACCDVLVCDGCFGPPGVSRLCPVCGTCVDASGKQTAFVVGALRDLARAVRHVQHAACVPGTTTTLDGLL